MTPIDYQVLANIVTDPNAWYDHVLKEFGEVRANAMLAAKVERYYSKFIQESVKPDYKNRSQRDAEEKERFALKESNERI